MSPVEYAKKVAAVKAVDEHIKVMKFAGSFCHVSSLIDIMRYTAFFFLPLNKHMK
jgi:hypothetical protein